MTNFDLQKPSYLPKDDDGDSLDDQTTNDASTEGSLLLGHIRGANDGVDYVGYEPCEPNPYHGTYSEM